LVISPIGKRFQFILPDTPDSNGPSALTSTPSSAPVGGYGAKTLTGSAAHKTAPPKTTTGIKKKITPVASGSTPSLLKDKHKKEKERSTPQEKDKKK
jgi:hypothetical protein